MGKSSKQTTGYWYPADFHHGIGLPIDKFLGVDGGSKSAWRGELTASGTITINAPNLYGGEKDQGGIVGQMDVMFGEATQVPNPYLVANFEAPISAGYNDYSGVIGSILESLLNPTPTPVGPAKISAWRGFTTVVGKNMRLGANNPYPQKLSYKIERIFAAMAEVGNWYPETAAIPYSDSTLEGYILGKKVTATSGSVAQPDKVLEAMAIKYGWSYVDSGQVYRFFRPNESGLIRYKTVEGDAGNDSSVVALIAQGWQIGQTAIIKGHSGELDLCVLTDAPVEPPAPPGLHWLANPATAIPTVLGDVYLWNMGMLTPYTISNYAINAAHWLYYLHAHEAVGREPIPNFNDASWRAAADKLYAEGFGICVEFDPDKESLAEHTQRIEKLIGGSVTRSMIDGQLYLDLARGDYDIDDLPILTDDDVLDFRELPSIQDGAINSVSVKYFDPERKEKIITPPDVDHALVDAFGMIHQVNEYLEIPTGTLAARLARRDRLSTTTPTRAFDLATKTKPYGWRRGTYFRLQLPKRGIADMVCILADKETGTLKSGAIRIKATQDIYRLPDTAFVEVEPGGSVGAPQTPTPITLQVAYEAPYTEAAQRIPRAELAALPADVGFLQAVAADLVGQRDYTMMVADAGGEYELARDGEWCPVAETAQAYGRIETVIQLGSAIGLASVLVGSAGLWDDEIVRVDAKDMEAGTLTLGRACADTTPAKHAAASRIWFYDDGAAIDTTEYTDGETVDVKLLSNTTSAQLALADATAMLVTFNQRMARPYPPAKFRVNDIAEPTVLTGELTATWVHRDRVLQADQQVDNEAATIGPEAGTTYTVRWYLDGVLELTDAGIAGTSSSYTPAGGGLVRVEAEAVRDGLISWQMQVREFYTSDPLLDQSGSAITDQNDLPIFMG